MTDPTACNRILLLNVNTHQVCNIVFYAIVVKAKGNVFCHSLEKTDGKVMCPVKDSICIGCKFSNNIIMHSPDAIN